MPMRQIGIIFSILFLISVLGVASDSVERVNKKSSLGSRGVSSTPTTTNASKASASSSTDREKGNNTTEKEKVDSVTATEEAAAPSAKAIKKRGGPTESAANLFDDEKGLLAGLDYPELQVVPRASERLQMESQAERNSLISGYWPVQISSIALIMAGSMSSGKYKQEDPTERQKKENQFASQMGVLVGAMWLGGTYYLNHSLSYGKALSEIKKINGKDKKSSLLKERLSEEALERTAKVAGMIDTLSIWSNFFLALYINEHSKQGTPSYTGLAIGLSFLPMLIDNRMIENWNKHQEYKRKIYAPITRLDFMLDAQSQRLTPLLGMRWQF